jgi:peptidoglycan/LPS O-acetylase OafA/YrhL
MTPSRINNNESVSIRYLRAVATILIVACHYLQTMDNRYSYVFNIGVQIFFVISGYLYGHQDTFKGDWFYKRWRKLYIPYILYVGIIVLLLLIFHVQEVRLVSILKLVFICQGFFSPGIKGVGQLWFITAIFACYCITPLLHLLTRRVKHNSVGLLLMVFGAISIGLFSRTNFGFLWYYSWLFNYLVGFFLARTNYLYKTVYLILSLLILIYLLWGISWEDIMLKENICIALHAYAAHTIFLASIYGSKIFNLKKIIWPFTIIDSYSFFIYFVHYPFTRTPWSLVGYSGSLLFDILLLIIVITIAVSILNVLTKYVGVIIDHIVRYPK